MARSERIRIERGLYRSDKTYIACATSPGARKAKWKTLGEVGLMEARAASATPGPSKFSALVASLKRAAKRRSRRVKKRSHGWGYIEGLNRDRRAATAHP